MCDEVVLFEVWGIDLETKMCATTARRRSKQLLCVCFSSLHERLMATVLRSATDPKELRLTRSLLGFRVYTHPFSSHESGVNRGTQLFEIRLIGSTAPQPWYRSSSRHRLAPATLYPQLRLQRESQGIPARIISEVNQRKELF